MKSRPTLAPMLLATAMLLGASSAFALLVDDDRAEWREGEIPDPPALNTKAMVQVDMPSYSSMKVGVDLDSLQISRPDGVVRYVTLLQGPDGSRSAYYQGLRCNSFETRTYARYRFADPAGWEKVSSEWHDLRDARSRYANALAKAGLCENTAPPISVQSVKRVFGRNPMWKDSSLGSLR